MNKKSRSMRNDDFNDLSYDCLGGSVLAIGMGKEPYIGAFDLSEEVPNMVEYVGSGRNGEIVRIPRTNIERLAGFFGNPAKTPERIYVKWDGSDVCVMDGSHIPSGTRSLLDNGKTIKISQKKQKNIINYKSLHIPGEVTVESPEIGFHVVGIAKVDDNGVIYTGHGKVRMSHSQHEFIGKPDRLVIEWDGKNLKMTPYLLKKMIDEGYVKTEEELIEQEFQPAEISTYDLPGKIYSDETGETLFIRIHGTGNFFRKVYDGEMPPIKPEIKKE